MEKSKCFQDFDQLWPYIKVGPSQCASEQPSYDNEQSVQLLLSRHHSLLFKLILTTRQHLHAVNTPKCTYAHTLVYFQMRIQAQTHTEARLLAHVCVPTHVRSFAIDILTKCTLCKLNTVRSSAIYVQPCRHFSVSLLPLSSSQSFLKVHICQWFLNQPAKFTTLRSDVFYSWLCCM